MKKGNLVFPLLGTGRFLAEVCGRQAGKGRDGTEK